MRYVYGCPIFKKDHPRIEVNHPMPTDENIKAGLIRLYWCHECGAKMERVPVAPMEISYSPWDVMVAWSDRNYRLFRSGSKERFSPDLINRPDKPIPQRDYRSR